MTVDSFKYPSLASTAIIKAMIARAPRDPLRVDGRGPRPDSLKHDRRVLFSGMTRATVRLELLATRTKPLNEAFAV